MKQLYIFLLAIPLIFTSCEKDDNPTVAGPAGPIGSTANFDDYPNLILGTWYLETVIDTYEIYDIDPVNGTHIEVYNQDPYEYIDYNGTWITFEDDSLYWGMYDDLTQIYQSLYYTVVDESIMTGELEEDITWMTINELSNSKLNFADLSIDTVPLSEDTLRVYVQGTEYIHYREIITPIESNRLTKPTNNTIIYDRIKK